MDKQKLLLIGALVIALVVLSYLVGRESNSLALPLTSVVPSASLEGVPSGQLNPTLVQEKQNCQTTADAWWNNFESKASSEYIDIKDQVHFNQALNACLLEYTWTRTKDGDQTSIVTNLTEDHALLELDLVPSGPTPGEYVTENGQLVNVGPFQNALGEYNKRLNILFSE